MGDTRLKFHNVAIILKTDFNNLQNKTMAVMTEIRKILYLSLISLLISLPSASAQSVQSILVLVNDEPISAFDVRQRVKLRMLGSKEARSMLKAKFKSDRTKQRFRAMMQRERPTSRQEAGRIRDRFVKQLRREVQRSIAKKMHKSTLKELIDERLMLQEAKKMKLLASDKEVEDRLQIIAKRNKNPKTGRPLSVKEFLGNLKRLGVSETTYKARMKASMSFQRVIIRKYGRQMSFQVGDGQVDRILAQSSNISKDTEFKLQKVTLKITQDSGQQALAKRLVDAEVLRSKFSTCDNIQKLVNSVGGGQVQALGKRKPSQLPKASRAVFMQAQQGEMTPPEITDNGIELYAVCSRRSVAGGEKERKAVKNKLRQQEFSLLRKRYLRDLHQEAFIEYKS